MSVLGLREIATRIALAHLDRIIAASHKIGSNNAWCVYLRLQIVTVAEEAPSVWQDASCYIECELLPASAIPAG
jgi:hypothetical protein